ncbi:C-5 cytosine-specific DNA methylase [Podila epigama]|nr:C-5 cytosine-specific DNA methylase [Podila epigama]
MADIIALEFFSGIGGLHHGFNASGVQGKVIESFDMNQQANDTYNISFGKNPISRGIDRLTAKDIEKYNANCWLMSPPCQPYTRGGKLLDLEDNRAKPLLHLLDQLEKMNSPPTYLFLENVKNFETSRSRERLVQLLHKMGYVFRECLLAPYHFGVPNDRLRYFLMARQRSTFDSPADPKGELSSHQSAQAFDPEKEPIYTSWPFPAFVEDPKKEVAQHEFNIPEITQFLDNDPAQGKHYLLPRQLILERPNFRFDVLRPSSRRSSCFTKAYGSHHVASGGGLLQTQNMEQETYDFSNSEAIADLGLRFLSPTEVARLHVFPLNESRTTENLDKEESLAPIRCQDTLTTVRPFKPHLVQAKGPFLQFPPKLTAIQRYKLLGNSLNVWVVAELLRGVLFTEHKGSPLPVYSQDVTEMTKPELDSTSEKHLIDDSSSTAETQDGETEAPHSKRPKQTSVPVE